MTSRFLSFVALSGMLIAAGCSGGGAGSGLSSGITPSAPTTGGGSTGSSSTVVNRGSFSVSFQVPAADVKPASSATSRSAQYISPGSTGLQILLSKDGLADATFAVGTATTPLQLQPTPPGGITAPTTAGAYGTNTTGTVGVVGTAQLSGNITDAQGAVGNVFNANTIPGSATVTPVVGQSFTVTNSSGGVLSATVKTVSGTPGSGLFLTATSTALTDASAQGFTTGNTINFGSSATLQSTYTYTFTPSGNAQNVGYYTATITFNNMTGGVPVAGTPYFIGVVLTDTAHNNYVLSEAQTPAVVLVPAFGPTTVPTLTLKPVVAGVFVPPPTALGAALESTIFATDELGYVIPNQDTNTGLTDDAAALTITTATAGGLTLSDYNGYNPAPDTASTLTTPPTGGVTTQEATLTAGPAVGGASATNYPNILGTEFVNYTQPTAPFTLPLNGLGTPLVTNADGVGNPILITCAAPGLQGLKISLTTTTPATVGGYTYTPGTNVPAVGPTVLASGSAGSSYPSAGTIDCNPSISVPIL